MHQEHDFHLETSGIPPEYWQPPVLGTIINLALDSTSRRAGSILNRKKGKKKYPCSREFQGSSTTFRVQPGRAGLDCYLAMLLT